MRKRRMRFPEVHKTTQSPIEALRRGKGPLGTQKGLKNGGARENCSRNPDRKMKPERVREPSKNPRSQVLVSPQIPVSARAAPSRAHPLPRRRRAWAQAKATVSHLGAFRAAPLSVFSEDRRNGAVRRKALRQG